MVSRRTREIGIRMALGASPADVRRSVMHRGLWLTLGGLTLGVAGAFLLTPGFFTDTIGFLLLFPPTRIWLASLVASRMVVSASVQGQSIHGQSNRGQSNRGPPRTGQSNRSDPMQGRPGQHHDGDVIDGVKYHRDDD